MKIFFLLNPSRVKNRWAIRERASKVAKSAGWISRFGEVDRANPHSASRLLDQAFEEDCSRVVVVGGDGTLHRVINLLSQKKRLASTDIAIVPAGTCNDFARFLGLKRRHLGRALKIACRGKSQPVDLARMDHELFLNNAGFGRRPSPAKRARPFQAIRSFHPIALRAEWDKGSIEGSFYMGLVSNAPFFSGGLHFSKNVSIHDELLDVYLLPEIPKWKLWPILALGRLGRPTRFKRLICLRVPRLRVSTQTDLWPQADGEPPSKSTRHVTFSVAAEKAMIVTP